MWPEAVSGKRIVAFASAVVGLSNSADDADPRSTPTRPTPHHACILAPSLCCSRTCQTSYVRTHPSLLPANDAGSGGSAKVRESTLPRYDSATSSMTGSLSMPVPGSSGFA
eukprot:scaffold82388_cov35-Tisochrysis_lutea.AAC.6